jgi:molecular chaperone GrpE
MDNLERMRPEVPSAGANDAAGGDDFSEVSDPAGYVAALAAERDALAAEKADTYDRLLRRQAEFENFRKRTEREKAEFFEYAGMESVRTLLPVLDDFERALKLQCPDEAYAKGMELIFTRLVDSLKKLGLEPVVSVGTKFDPNLHHAIDRETSADVEDQTILAEYQRGYNFKGKSLRPAMVKVAVH